MKKKKSSVVKLPEVEVLSPLLKHPNLPDSQKEHSRTSSQLYNIKNWVRFWYRYLTIEYGKRIL